MCLAGVFGRKTTTINTVSTLNVLDTLKIHMGCGGFSNPDWTAHGLIYEGVSPAHFLSRYTEYFEAVELNTSFYHVPSQKALASMLEKSGGHVRFCIKVHQSLTHDRTAEPEIVRRILEHAAPLRDANVLGPYLAQFPYSFRRTTANRRYLQWLTRQFAGHALGLEFRHESWDKPEVRSSLEQAGLIWVTPDYPPLQGLPTPTLQATHEVAYLRLHGRNTHAWWEGESANERHDYRYPMEELEEWAAQIAALSGQGVKEVYIFWQTTTKGHALHNAPMLREALAVRGLRAERPPIPLSDPERGGLF